MDTPPVRRDGNSARTAPAETRRESADLLSVSARITKRGGASQPAVTDAGPAEAGLYVRNARRVESGFSRTCHGEHRRSERFLDRQIDALRSLLADADVE